MFRQLPPTSSNFFGSRVLFPTLPSSWVAPLGRRALTLCAALVLPWVASSCAPIVPLAQVEPTSIEDHESDDAADLATAVSVNSGLAQVQGRLTPGDVDWYSFLAPNRGELSVTINNIGTSGVVGEATLQDSLHIRRASVPATASGENKSSRRLAVARGQRYWLEITNGSDADAAYRVDFRFRDN